MIFTSDCKRRLLNHFWCLESGHFRSRSFSVIFKNDSVIWFYSIYKYIFILYYRGRFAPRKRKWPKMTVTDNDRIRLLKVIREEEVCVSNVMVISRLTGIVVPPGIMLCIVKQHISLFALSQFSCSFCENLDKIYQKLSLESVFSSFHSAFSPSYFCLLKGWKVPSEPLFLASRGVFLLLSLQKNNSAFLVIFAWVMWFSVDNGIWLFRG